MTLHNVAVAAKDGGGSTITGGIRQHDTSGTAAGPNVPENIIVDSTGAEVLGTTADAAVTTDVNGSAISFLRGLVKTLGSLTNTTGALDVNIKSGTPAVGATTAAASSPVTLPTDAAAITNTVTPTVSASPAYTAGDNVGGKMTFSAVGRTPDATGSGIVNDITLTFKTVQTAEFDLYLFDSDPSASTWTDNAANAINATDVPKCIGCVKMTKNYSGLGTHTVYKPDMTTFAPITFRSANLYGVLNSVGTPTLGSTTDLTVKLGII